MPKPGSQAGGSSAVTLVCSFAASIGFAAVVEAEPPREDRVHRRAHRDRRRARHRQHRTAADAQAIEGEIFTLVVASLLRIVWLYGHRPDGAWSGLIDDTAQQPRHPANPGPAPRPEEPIIAGRPHRHRNRMITITAGAASYLANQANPTTDLDT